MLATYLSSSCIYVHHHAWYHLISRHECARPMSAETHLRCFPTETTSIFQSWCLVFFLFTQTYPVSRHVCAIHMSKEIHLQCFPIETTSLFRSVDIWCCHTRLGTDVPYTCQWIYISDVFLLTPFHCFGPRIFGAIIYGRISYLGTSATSFLLLCPLPSAY